MIFAEPPRSQGDLYFRLFGFPIRIHWTFWLVTLVLSISTRERTPPVEVVLWTVAVTISIIIHELGHAFLQRHYGGRPRIVLYGMGGLAICDDCDRSSRSQILICLAGPFAGFAFAALILILMAATGNLSIEFGETVIYGAGNTEDAAHIRLLGTDIYWQQAYEQFFQRLVFNLLFINILWGLLNLLPIYPLDGGQISREVCQIGNPRGGIILSLQISVAAAVGMAVFGLLFWNSFYTALMFGYLAYMSFQILQSYRQSLW
jgi:stage IV sporulation protein FB